jgi:hypothetical protein
MINRDCETRGSIRQGRRVSAAAPDGHVYLTVIE